MTMFGALVVGFVLGTWASVAWEHWRRSVTSIERDPIVEELRDAAIDAPETLREALRWAGISPVRSDERTAKERALFEAHVAIDRLDTAMQRVVTA